MIGIRVDANDKIAMGHLMRCIAIADQLRDMRQEIIFFVSDVLAKQLLERKNFKCVCLHNDYNQKDAEIDTLLACLKQNNVDRLLVDSYEVTPLYMRKLNKYVKLIYMDDLQQRHYEVDRIVNYTLGLDRELYTSLGYLEEQLLIGNEYIPLRKEFATSRITVKREVENILITTGGTDSYDVVMSLIHKLDENVNHTIKRKIVVGAFYSKIDELDQYVKTNDSTELFYNISNMQEVMCQCDVAISAGGTTLMELSACGIPTICFSIADNQLSGVKAFSERGLMIYSGDVRQSMERVLNNIVFYLDEMVKDYSKRKRISKELKKMIDGKGARRIAEEISLL